jgi:DNA-binding NarL/FixJ family response regulator
MIFPERVFGSSGTTTIRRGLAMGPISLATCWRSSSAALSPSPGWADARRITNATTAWPLVASAAPTTADERIRAMRIRETPVPAAARPDLSEVFARLRQVAARTTDPQTAQELRELLDLEPAAGVDRRLTTRQVDVLALVALGLTNEGIAASLGLSSLTVKSYLRSAMARLDARTRYEVVVEARRLKIIP